MWVHLALTLSHEDADGVQHEEGGVPARAWITQSAGCIQVIHELHSYSRTVLVLMHCP